jgi:hypothetical protein
MPAIWIMAALIGFAQPAPESAVLAYVRCIQTTARQFATSPETAPVVARAAVEECRPGFRAAIEEVHGSDLSPGAKAEAERYLAERAQQMAELEVVRARSRP